ncbi:MAG: hypothetical protein AAFW89_05790 [Bacteroidota bacterium]
MKKGVPTKILTVLSLLLFTVSAVNAGETTESDNKPIVEITDPSSLLKFGLTQTHLYLEFPNEIREHLNQSLVDSYSIEEDYFFDSDGLFILGDPIVLESNRIEYSIQDIKNVEIVDGHLIFQYTSKHHLGFEDILLIDGTLAIDQFLANDLQILISTFNELK